MENIIATKTLCNWGGIVILAIDDHYVTHAEDYGDGIVGRSKTRIFYNAKGNPYFMRKGRRQYLDTFMKVRY